ncbi:MAG: 30S ribosomal protein S20 [Oscillospiraceae bacterium]|jgi:small subunit ribosomal protein S20|nr:30S ribosomal protein S20 [Oscillospiraceae bacterium]
MPNIKSAKKRVRVSQKANLRNKSARSAMKTFIKKAEKAILAGAEDRETLAKNAFKAVDQASSKGVIHKNKASRTKSQIAKKLNRAV